MAKYRAILIMSVTALLFYAVNWFILLGYPQEYSGYHYNLFAFYGFFWVCAALILFTTHLVHAKSRDNTGYVFIGVTLVQMGLSYIILKPILASGDSAHFERINFFIIFILFLAIETLLTIRLLNNKQ